MIQISKLKKEKDQKVITLLKIKQENKDKNNESRRLWVRYYYYERGDLN
jgi:hypothetical protein